MERFEVNPSGVAEYRGALNPGRNPGYWKLTPQVSKKSYRRIPGMQRVDPEFSGLSSLRFSNTPTIFFYRMPLPFDILLSSRHCL